MMDTRGERRRTAIRGAQAAVAELARLDVHALVTGSLARGGFDAGSDVDLLVTECPRHLKYAIEAKVEDAVGGLRFDVVYLDELSPLKAARFTAGACDAAELR